MVCQRRNAAQTNKPKTNGSLSRLHPAELLMSICLFWHRMCLALLSFLFLLLHPLPPPPWDPAELRPGHPRWACCEAPARLVCSCTRVLAWLEVASRVGGRRGEPGPQLVFTGQADDRFLPSSVPRPCLLYAMSPGWTLARTLLSSQHPQGLMGFNRGPWKG